MRLLVIFLFFCVGASATRYEHNNSDSEGGVSYNGFPTRIGQTFTVGAEKFVIDSMAIQFNRTANYAITYAIYAVSGGFPTGAALSTGSIPADDSETQWRFVEMTPAALQAFTTYAIVFYSTATYSGLIQAWYSTDNNYAGGQALAYNGSSWSVSPYASWDLGFDIYGKNVPIITTNPVAVTQCMGTNATFEVVVDSDFPTYQWRRNGISIFGATSASYTINNIYPGIEGTYSVTVTENLLSTSVTSSGAVLTVQTPPSFVTQPTSVTQCEGTDIELYTLVSGTGLSFQWQKDGVDISGGTTTSYTRIGITTSDAGNYTLDVTGTCGSTTSQTAAVIVTLPPVITTQPSSVGACPGTDATFYVVATGTAITYQWKKDGENISGATGSQYKVMGVEAADEGYYSVTITGTCGAVTSNSVLLTSYSETSSLLTGIVAYWKLDETSGTNLNDEVGTNDGTATGVTVNQTGAVGQSILFDGNSDYVTLTSAITQTTGSYSFWIYPTDWTDDRLILADDGYESRIFTRSVYGWIRVETNTNGQEFQFNSSPPPLNTWSHVVLARTGDVMKYYLNGVYVNSVTVSSAAALTVSQIGYNGRSYRGNIDEVGIWNKELTSDEVLLTYNDTHPFVTSPCSPEPPGLTKKLLLAGKTRGILLAGKTRFYSSPISVEPPPSLTDTIEYFLYDDFESWTTASVNSYDSLMGRWPIRGFFMPAQQSIVDVGGSHGKVWDSYIPTSGETSMQMAVNLGDTASEVWCELDFWVEADFNNIGQGGIASHKFPGGLFASDIDSDVVEYRDSVNAIGGGGAWFNLVSGNSNDYLMAYPFFQDPDNWGGHANGDSGAFQLPYGEWIRLAFRMRVNDTPGKYDGFFEIYRNASLIIRYGKLKSRSVTQGEDFGKIESMRWNYFFGAYPRSSARENHIRMDNLVVYKYKPGAVMYNYGLNEFSGQVPPTVMPPASSKKPAELFVDETYTNVTDTIYDMGKDKGYLYWPYYKNEIVTKEVTLPSGTINYTFLVEQFGFDWPDECSYVKVYSGTGVGKIWLATYGRASGCGYTDPSGTYNIADNEATFEIYPGSANGYTKGVAIRYWQP